MSHYYFDLSDGTREEDTVGVEFASLDKARAQAVRYASELLRDNEDGLWQGHRLCVELRDENRQLLATVVTSATSHAAGSWTLAPLPFPGTET